MMRGLKGKRVLVRGDTKKIGEATVQRFHDEVPRVFFCGLVIEPDFTRLD